MPFLGIGRPKPAESPQIVKAKDALKAKRLQVQFLGLEAKERALTRELQLDDLEERIAEKHPEIYDQVLMAKVRKRWGIDQPEKNDGFEDFLKRLEQVEQLRDRLGSNVSSGVLADILNSAGVAELMKSIGTHYAPMIAGVIQPQNGSANGTGSSSTRMHDGASSIQESPKVAQVVSPAEAKPVEQEESVPVALTTETVRILLSVINQAPVAAANRLLELAERDPYVARILAEGCVLPEDHLRVWLDRFVATNPSFKMVGDYLLAHWDWFMGVSRHIREHQDQVPAQVMATVAGRKKSGL